VRKRFGQKKKVGHFEPTFKSFRQESRIARELPYLIACSWQRTL
jgi:hypothetical protein